MNFGYNSMPLGYYLNLSLVPFFSILIFLKNWYKMTKQAIRWTSADVQSALDSNLTHYKKRKNASKKT